MNGFLLIRPSTLEVNFLNCQPPLGGSDSSQRGTATAYHNHIYVITGMSPINAVSIRRSPSIRL